jgi:hypothetical protein
VLGREKMFWITEGLPKQSMSSQYNSDRKKLILQNGKFHLNPPHPFFWGKTSSIWSRNRTLNVQLGSNQRVLFCLHVIFCASWSAVKSRENQPWTSSPCSLYVLSILGKISETVVELSRVNPVLQKPMRSLDNCRSHNTTTSGKQAGVKANW